MALAKNLNGKDIVSGLKVGFSCDLSYQRY